MEGCLPSPWGDQALGLSSISWDGGNQSWTLSRGGMAQMGSLVLPFYLLNMAVSSGGPEGRGMRLSDLRAL